MRPAVVVVVVVVFVVVAVGALGVNIDDLVYEALPADPACVRLLTRTGPVGCSVSDGRGVLYDLDDVVNGRVYDPLDPVSVLLPYSALNRTTIDQLRSRCRLAGILAHSLSKATPSEFPSPAEASPFASLSSHPDHIWNPFASNLSAFAFDFAIVSASDADLPALTKFVAENRERIKEGKDPRNQAQFNYPMDASGDSVSCLKSGNCLPIGGYSVWASRGRTDNATAPVVAAITQLDASALIHAQAMGANTAMSGLLALLGASDVVAHLQDLDLDSSSRRIVFAAFNGEYYDLIGSRSFSSDLSSFSCNAPSDAQCLDPFRIDTSFSSIAGMVKPGSSIVDISQIGSGQLSDPFYFHTVSPQLTAAIRAASDGIPMPVRPASAVSAIGLPPSSAWSFPDAVDKLVLTGYDTAFSFPAYGSELDREYTETSLQRICSASTVVARTLLAQVGYASAQAVSANCTLIKELSDCVGPSGFDCSIARTVISADAIAASTFSKKDAVSHYASVYQQVPTTQVTDTPRLVHDWWTSIGLQAHYHDAVDPDLRVGPDGFWQAADGPSRLWTESNWMRQRVRVYVTEAPWTGAVMFALGFFVAAASAVSSYFLTQYALATIKLD